jgi:hypothetical protein
MSSPSRRTAARLHQLNVESARDRPEQNVANVARRNTPPELSLHRRDPELRNPTRRNQAIVLKHGRHVQCQPVQRNHPLHGNPDGTDTSVPDVHPTMLAPSVRDDSKLGQRVDDGPLERRHERHDLPKPLQLQNRIDDDLPRSMKRDVPPTLDVDDVDPKSNELVIRQK